MNKKVLLSLFLFGLLVLGIFAGVKLVQQRQIFFSRAFEFGGGESGGGGASGSWSVCTPGEYNRHCTGNCGGCAAGEGEQEVKQCNADGSGWDPSHGECSTDCSGPCGNPVPTSPPPPAPTTPPDNCPAQTCTYSETDSSCSSGSRVCTGSGANGFNPPNPPGCSYTQGCSSCNCSGSNNPTPTSAPAPTGSNYCAGYFDCTGRIGVPNGTCIQNGKTCTNFTRYKCNYGGRDYCDNNCTEPCNSGISPTRGPTVSPVVPTSPTGSTTTCVGQRTWADIYDGLRRAGYNGPWDQPSALSAFNRTSCPTCSNSDATQYLSPPLAEACLTCIKNNDSGLPNVIREMNPDLFRGCNEGELITFWCNGGISAQGTETCNSVKNGQCASSCGGGPTPTPAGNTAFYRISKTPFADETSGWQTYSSEPMVVSLDFPEVTIGQDLTVFAQFKSTTGALSASFTKTIKYIGEGPRITSLSCSYSPTGDGTEVRILGENFGDQGTNSKVFFNNISAQILSWANIVPTSTPMPALTETPTPEATATITPTTPTPTRIPPRVPLDSTGSGVLGVTSSSTIVAKIDERLQENQAIPVYLETNEGRRAPGTAQLYCTIKVVSISFNTLPQCRPPQKFGNTNVRVQIYEDTQTPGVRPVYDQKITINADGTPTWVAPPLEVGKNYVLVIKGPQGLGYEKKFTATAGTIALSDLSLPVGDIAPLSNPDNVVNSADYSELKREWNAISDVMRAGDFNLDNRVNSVDYSCMRLNFNNNGAKFLTGQ